MERTIVFSHHQKMLPLLELVCLQGAGKGMRFSVCPGRRTFGRSEDNDIVLPDPTVSSKHGVLVYTENGRVHFYDTESRNGISHNGKQAPLIILKPGQQIQIGGLYLKLVRPTERAFFSRRRLILLLVTLVIPGFLLTPLAGNHSIPPQSPSIPIRSPAPAARKIHHAPDSRRTETLARGKKMTGFLEVSQLAEQAGQAFANGRFAEAFQIWRELSARDPYNQSAQEGLQKLEKMAGRLYEEALMMKNASPSQAREKLQALLTFTDPSSPTYNQAKSLLSEGT